MQCQWTAQPLMSRCQCSGWSLARSLCAHLRDYGSSPLAGTWHRTTYEGLGCPRPPRPLVGSGCLGLNETNYRRRIHSLVRACSMEALRGSGRNFVLMKARCIFLSATLGKTPANRFSHCAQHLMATSHTSTPHGTVLSAVTVGMCRASRGVFCCAYHRTQPCAVRSEQVVRATAAGVPSVL